jgi:hypothetical protein
VGKRRWDRDGRSEGQGGKQRTIKTKGTFNVTERKKKEKEKGDRREREREDKEEGRKEGRKEGRRLSIEYRSTKTNGTCLLSKFTRIPSHSYLVEIHLEPASSNFS